MVSLVGEIITSSINANMFTYEVAPIFNLMEDSILALMRQYCGWTNKESPLENGDGLLAPGGAISNLYALLAARHHTFPDIKTSGYRDGPRPAILISKHVGLIETEPFSRRQSITLFLLVSLFNQACSSNTGHWNGPCLRD